MTPRPSQSGNVLFYILICVALFAALSYAFSRGGDSGASKVTDDKARLIATEIINYGASVKEAVAKLRLRGCAENQFDFSNSVYLTIVNSASMPANTSAPADDSCDIFSTNGAKLVPYIAPVAAGSYPVGTPITAAQIGHGSVHVFQQTDVGTNAAAGTVSANELLFAVNWIDTPTCLKINDLLGVPNASATSPPAFGIFQAMGTYSNGSFNGLRLNGVAQTRGKIAFCISGPATEGNRFYQVLLAR